MEKNQEIEISKLKEEKNKLFETENINLIFHPNRKIIQKKNINILNIKH